MDPKLKAAIYKHINNFLDEIVIDPKEAEEYKKWVPGRVAMMIEDKWTYEHSILQKMMCRHDWISNRRSQDDCRERRVCVHCKSKQVRGEMQGDTDKWFDSHFAIYMDGNVDLLAAKWSKITPEEAELYKQRYEIKNKISKMNYDKQ